MEYILDIEQSIIKEYISSKSEKSANDFVRAYRKFVYSTALRYVEDYDDADDIAQEVFIKALDNLHKFEGKSSIKSWLYRITINQSLNFKRKRKFISFFSLKDENIENNILIDDNSPDKELEKEEFNLKFMKVISQLPEKQRETFALRYFENMTYEEISNLIGTSVGGLKANYHQAVKKITKMMK